MTQGGSLPYQLRPNKAIERLIFIDLLRRLDSTIDFESSRYSYWGFGGPQMEDFRLLHENFPLMQMTSIEEDSSVHKRQIFNGPHTNVSYENLSSGNFIEAFEPQNPCIVWLDYVRPSERPAQIAEYQSLLRRIDSEAIIKITVNASASSQRKEPGIEDIHQARFEAFHRDFGRFFDARRPLAKGRMVTDLYPLTLLQVIEGATTEVMANRRGWRFLPLGSALYADGQQMLTVTGFLGPRERAAEIIGSKRLLRWQFLRKLWSDPVEIDIPEFTLRERLRINQMLPKRRANPGFIERKLGFSIAGEEVESHRLLNSYIRFHRYFPHFARIGL